MLKSNREEMYLLGVLCLLSAALALPPPELLHTNLPPIPQPDDQKGDDIMIDPTPPPGFIPSQNSEESKPLAISSENPKLESDEKKDKPDDVVEVIVDKPLESKESIDSKESKDWEDSKHSQESHDSKELQPPKEEPEEPKKESSKEKESDKSKESKEDKNVSKYEESKESFDSAEPILVQLISKGPLSNLLSKLPSWPWHWPSFLHPRNQNPDEHDQVIYIIRESEPEFDNDLINYY